MEHQQRISYQLDLFERSGQNVICSSDSGEDVNQTTARKAKQVNVAGQQRRALAENLMEIICSTSNLKRAYRQVKRNKGVAGIDSLPVGKFPDWYRKHGETLVSELLSGDYTPSPVKEVRIPKPKGGTRKIGIPTVRDRVIQQAIFQVLQELYDKSFSESSYGFRPGRKVSQALCKASEYVSSGKNIVVDIDMKNFFDEVNHDRLMYRLSRRIGDKVLLQLIRKYLQSGVMRGGLISLRKKGTPQGSPLSPILSNIVLDELDKELEERGHSFIRYADDISIYVSSHKSGERVKHSISKYLTDKLKLQVNEEKSKVSDVGRAEILGHTILYDGTIIVSHSSRMRLRKTIKEITRRNRGVSFAKLITELNIKLRGWFEYFKHSKSKRLFQSLDSWIRRKLRCYRMKQTKRVIGLVRFLKQQGVKTWQAWILALSGKGWWRKSSSPQAHQAMGNSWFNEQNLFSLSLNYGKLNN